MTLRVVWLVIVATALAVGCAGETAPSGVRADPTVTVESGKLEGSVVESTRRFAGIPYAAPPTGERRWQPPAPVPAWHGIRDGDNYGPGCPQTPGMFTGPQSEDCLTLNVWAPSDGERLPVLVYFHGGALTVGSSGLYDPSRLVRRGKLIAVTVNYRLGALGFLGHPALTYGGGKIGNFGFGDQQLALRWVQRNIAAFGGDPAKVTISGESAGGTSVCAHLAAPSSKGLFRAAISQSGPCEASTRAEAEKVGKAYAAGLGCADAACLRAVPAEKLGHTPLVSTTNLNTIPAAELVADGATVPADGAGSGPESLIGDGMLTAGPASAVPTLIGSTRNEVLGAVVLKDPNLTPVKYRSMLAPLGADAGEVAAQYPPNQHRDSPARAYGTLVSDAFVCQIHAASHILARRANSFQYQFDDPNPAVPELAGPAARGDFGPVHGTDVAYLFNFPGTAFSPAQQHLSDQMVGYWSNFVNTGDPNGKDLPQWRNQRDGDDAVLSLAPDATRMIGDFGTEHQCVFWQSLR